MITLKFVMYSLTKIITIIKSFTMHALITSTSRLCFWVAFVCPSTFVFSITPKILNESLWNFLYVYKGPDQRKKGLNFAWERSGINSGYKKIQNFSKVPFSIYFSVSLASWLTLLQK